MEKTCYKKSIVKGIVAILILTCFGHQSCHQGTVPQTREIAKAEMSDDDLQNYQYLFSEATKNKVLGDIPRAIDYYQKCLMINPGSDASMYALSSLYSMVGEYSKSLEYAIEASKLDPDNIWYKLQLANLYRALSVLDKSIEVYEEIHRRFPERDDLYFALGNLYAENDQHTEAIDVFDRLENQYGLQENIILAKEESYEAMKMYDEAIQEVRNLKKLFPDKVRYRLMEAEIFYLRGDIQDSDSLYRVIEETAPDDHLVIISRIGFYRETGDTNMTVTYLDKMIRDATLELDLKLEFMAALLNDDKDIRFLGPDLGTLFLTLEKAYEGDVRVVGMVADYYVRSGNYIEASKFYKAYIEKDKTNYLAWERLMYVENILGNYDELYAYSHEALSLFRNAPLAYFFNGLACTELNRSEEAIPVLREGLEYTENDDELTLQFYALLGDAYRNIGAYDESNDAFEKALDTDPENTIILNNYGYYLALQNKDLKRALEMSGKTLKKEPGNPTYLDTYGWILFQMGKYRKAEKYIEKAVKLNDQPSAEVLEHYGDVLEKLGEFDRAVEYWNLSKEHGGERERIEGKIQGVR